MFALSHPCLQYIIAYCSPCPNPKGGKAALCNMFIRHGTGQKSRAVCTDRRCEHLMLINVDNIIIYQSSIS